MGAYLDTYNSRRKKNKIVGTIVTLIFLILFLFLCFPILPFVQKVFLGIFGLTAYPLTLLGVLIGLAVGTNRRFNMKPKNFVYLLLTAIFFVSLLHIIFSGKLINSYGKLTFKNYGRYITDTFGQAAGITVGGALISIFFYPLVGVFGVVGGSVVNAIILTVLVGFTVDYYMSKKNQTHISVKENWSRNKQDSSNAAFRDTETIAGNLTGTLLDETSAAKKINTPRTAFTEYTNSPKSKASSAFTKYAQPLQQPETIAEDYKQDTQELQPTQADFAEYARNTLFGSGDFLPNKPTQDHTLLNDDKAQMGYDPQKYSSLKEYIKYPYVPPVFVKNTGESQAQDDRQNHIQRPEQTGIERIRQGLESIQTQQNLQEDRNGYRDTNISRAAEIQPEPINNTQPNNPFNVEDINIRPVVNNENYDDIFDDEEIVTQRPNPRRTPNNESTRFGEQMFGNNNPIRDNKLVNNESEYMPEPDNFGRRAVGVRGKDLSPRKRPERLPRQNNEIFTNNNLKTQPAQIFNPHRSFVGGANEHKPKTEQIELPVSKSPFGQKGETDARYNPPPTTILVNNSDDPSKYGGDFEEKSERLEEVLDSFKIPAKVVGVIKGPTVTKFELAMPVGIPVKKVLSYDGDIAMALMSKNGVRIEAPILGKNAVGVEIPNERRCVVGLREILESKEFQSSTAILPVAIGKNIYGETVVTSMAKMIHLLVAGSTGSGKTVFLHNLILSLMYKSSPEQLRFIMIDPKRVEFAIYNGMPHLMLPNVVTECDKAINAFTWAVKEMDRRYKMFQQCQTPNIELFNKCDAVKNGEEKKVPYIVIIVDELADLMLVGKREVESKIQRLAQLGRACGIFLVIATQRPSVEVVTGTIKSNLPTRIAFALASFVDSRTILDEAGAEKLLGKGDMLYSPQDASVATRLQAAYVETTDIKKVIDYIKENNEIYFDEEVEQSIMSNKEDEEAKTQSDTGGSDDKPDYDEILPQVLKFFIESNTASTSLIQRRFKVGYARAARILDEMEVAGYVSPASGSKARNVYITMEQYENIFGTQDED